MPGSAAMLVRLNNGLEMAVVVNKVYFNGFIKDLKSLFRNIVSGTFFTN